MSNPNPDFYVNPDYIHKGGWTNWNGDVTTGGKITFSKNGAELLMIFIGIFFVFMEAGLWSLISFGLFLWRRSRNLELAGNPPTTTSLDRDALWHQQQATLRNGGDDRAVGITYISLWLNYGWNNLDVIRRTWPTIFMALTSFGIFLIALPFIAAYLMLDNQGVEVLIHSPLCGWWEASFENDLVIASTDVANRTREAIQYADTCYESDSPSELCDNFLVKRNLEWTGWHNTECPFGNGTCLGDEKFPAFQMETMLLDSHEHFGMNSPKQGRFAIQRTTTCAPLDVKAWSLVEDGTIDGENITKVYFGATPSDDYTFGVSNLQYLAGPDYNLGSYYSYAYNESVGTFVPIKQLRRTDADVSVISLNNNLIPVAGINGPCRDPFFSATNRQDEVFPDWYWPDQPITAIGCADQYAFHNPVTHEWSNQTGMLMLGTDITKESGLSPMQIAAMNTMRWALGEIGAMGRLIETIGSDALRAKKYPGVFAGYQNPLPNDQWKKEVSFWFNVQLAAFQLQFIRISTGPQDTAGMTNALPALTEGSDTDYEGLICRSQKIQNNQFKNFYRAGFISLALIGGLMIIAPWLIIKCVVFWGRGKSPFVLEWISYGHLQLLRMANEEVEVRGWTKCNSEVPFSPLKRNIATVYVDAVTNGEPHPKLKKPREETIDAVGPGDQTVEGTEHQSNAEDTEITHEETTYLATGALDTQAGADTIPLTDNTSRLA
ncbi:hypothetical protein G7Z17_g6619 [Cylindrodendrum hubeiense]|uniref:Uncharacterized protein n=1 Tax=Cylindrodendrum hubeiense TaxID=595255 RepID=A0A9P5HEV2_9HYPO|nr:hypothetical protein G7Z17_g6619 [Cylindrodendrum hubeiense]